MVRRPESGEGSFRFGTALGESITQLLQLCAKFALVRIQRAASRSSHSLPTPRLLVLKWREYIVKYPLCKLRQPYFGSKISRNSTAENGAADEIYMCSFTHVL